MSGSVRNCDTEADRTSRRQRRFLKSMTPQKTMCDLFSTWKAEHRVWGEAGWQVIRLACTKPVATSESL